MKRRSAESATTVTVLGFNRAAQDRILSRADISISTSKDEVGAPLFYREVNLPFLDAVKDPSRIRWRFGPVSAREQPPVILEKLPVCGNCHSFSADGAVLGMDVDYANDRGSYAISPVTSKIVLDKDKIITWTDYRKEDGQLTFGFLSRLSPDGRYVLSTVKDRSVFVPKDDLAFSQLFFPIKGVLVFYDRETGRFHPLPGADDPEFVQCNPVWSPDGKHIVFARSKAYHLESVRDKGAVLLSREDCQEFLDGRKTFLFDLYRIPFNEGKGGEAKPLTGASSNGMSNYFPKFSPDGKWIAFCKARSFMLLQPDSELYIIAARGGEARRLLCNTGRMNSWHSWSPNGKWLVFSSKAFSDYTQLFLTHIDEQGNSSVPVVLSRFTSPDRAANIPEFVNAAPNAVQHIFEAFVDDYNYYRAAVEYLRDGDAQGATPLLRKSLEVNPNNVKARIGLANILSIEGKREEAKHHLIKALDLEPDHPEANQSLAIEFRDEGRFREAADHCRRALQRDPEYYSAQRTLGQILLDSGELDQAMGPLLEALRLKPEDLFANYICGNAFHRRSDLTEAAKHYRNAVNLDPEYVPALLGLASIHMADPQSELYNIKEALALAAHACDATGHQNAAALEILAGAQLAAGRIDDAATTTRKAWEVARAAGDQNSADRLQETLQMYERALRRK